MRTLIQNEESDTPHTQVWQIPSGFWEDLIQGREAWEGQCGTVQLGGEEWTGARGPHAALGWKDVVFNRVQAQVQIGQNAAPDAKGEEGAQAWRGSLLLEGREAGT